MVGTQTTTAAATVSFIHVIEQKAYELANHLGNVLVTVADERAPQNTGTTVTSYKAIVMSATDYSAFGAPLANRTWSSPGYRYGFNGKEKQDELHGNSGDAYDFEARIYDARLGRFLSRDKFSTIAPGISPYVFAGNSPIGAIDMNGDSIYVLSNGILYNASSKEGRLLAAKYGYDVLAKTTDGAKLLNQYANSSTHDIYVGTGTSAAAFENTDLQGNPTGVTDGAITLNGTQALIKNGSITIDEEAIKKYPNAKLGASAEFNGVKIKNKNSTVNTITFNPSYLAHTGVFADIYDLAETLDHEIDIHIRNFTGDNFKDHTSESIPKDNDVGIVTRSNYGLNVSDLYSNGDLIKGSHVDKIVGEINSIKSKTLCQVNTSDTPGCTHVEGYNIGQTGE